MLLIFAPPLGAVDHAPRDGHLFVIVVEGADKTWWGVEKIQVMMYGLNKAVDAAPRSTGSPRRARPRGKGSSPRQRDWPHEYTMCSF